MVCCGSSRVSVWRSFGLAVCRLLAKLPLAMVSLNVPYVSVIHLYDTVYVSISRETDGVFGESLLRYGAISSHWRVLLRPCLRLWRNLQAVGTE